MIFELVWIFFFWCITRFVYHGLPSLGNKEDNFCLVYSVQYELLVTLMSSRKGPDSTHTPDHVRQRKGAGG